MNTKINSFKVWLTLVVLTLGINSCRDESEVSLTEIKFQINSVSSTGNSGGRVSAEETPASVLVSIRDASGKMVAEQRTIRLHKFGNAFLSEPITLLANLGSHYLTEYFVLDESGSVVYATPREGSSLAHLVDKPLDIEFAINKNEITTIAPEVLEVNDTSIPSDYGYGQFGFDVIKKIEVIFSSFVKGESNFELTDSHLKIEALADTVSSDTTALWTYETDLQKQANMIAIREAPLFRVTASKSGYHDWTKIVALTNGDKVEIIFEESEWGIEMLWNKNFGGSKEEDYRYFSGHVAIPTADGGVLFAGHSKSNDFDCSNKGDFDFWIIKANSSGDLQWKRNYGGSNQEIARSVVECSDGSGYIVTGKTASSDGDVKRDGEPGNGWMIKLDLNGELLWQKISHDIITDVVISNAGTDRLFITGYADQKNKYALVTGEMDTNGNILWQKNYSDRPSYEIGATITKVSDGYFLIRNASESIIKLNNLGDFQWSKEFSSDRKLNVFSMQVLELSNAYQLFVTKRNYTSSGSLNCNEPGEYPAGLEDVAMIRLDFNGNEMWEKTVDTGFKGNEVIHSLIKLPTNNVLIVGYVVECQQNKSVQGGLIMEATIDGKLVGKKIVQGGFDGAFSSIVPTSTGYVVMGRTYGEGFDSPGTYGHRDIWMMKVRL